MVKNESDIIESFCRHTLTFCDGMIICDDESVDDTAVIIRKLKDEGLNIVLLDNKNTFGYYQDDIINKLTHIAIDEYGAELILPLDADEFLYTNQFISDSPPLRYILGTLQASALYSVMWINYVPTDAPRQNHIFLPQFFRQFYSTEYGVGKVFVGAEIYKANGGRISQGNHFFLHPNGMRAGTASIADRVFMAHYPIRSAEQAMTKAIIGWINTLCVPGRTSGIDKNPTHWGQMFEFIKNNGTLSMKDLYYFTQKHIAPGDLSVHSQNIPLAEGFIPSTISLRYTDYKKSQNNFMKIILSHFEYVLNVLMKQQQ
ncbi:MAG: glycosyltransferase family 2 protein [Clostridiales bacterium]|jgi:glycosyltransferase involved in cell wall biosynthesis|nr:glycosyltransferase family 2 protein [Clostridiales bacterium]